MTTHTDSEKTPNVGVDSDHQAGMNLGGVQEKRGDLDLVKEALECIKSKLGNLPSDPQTDRLKYDLMQLATADHKVTGTDQDFVDDKAAGTSGAAGNSQPSGNLGSVGEHEPGFSDDDSPSEDENKPQVKLGNSNADARSRRVVRDPNVSTVDQDLVAALQRLDSRTVPRPEIFNINSAQSLTSFFRNFEEYCDRKYNCGRNGWIPELGRSLEGEAFSVFEALRSPTDSYDVVKSKLFKWYDESKSLRKLSKATLFKNSEKKVEESLYVYGARLEKIFKSAFPRKCVETSHTLRQKYLDTVPSDFAQQIEMSMALATVNGNALTWSQILRIAAIRDNSCVALQDTNNTNCYNVQKNVFASSKSFSDAASQSKFGGVGGVEIVGRGDRWKASGGGHSQIVASSGNWKSRGSLHSGKVLTTNANSNQMTQRNFQSKSPGGCSYCGKQGHDYNICRKRLKQCLICGSGNHFRRECKYARQTTDSKPDRQSPLN